VHRSDEALLRTVMLFFKGVGKIEFSSDKKYVSYKVYKLSDIIQVIIPAPAPPRPRARGIFLIKFKKKRRARASSRLGGVRTHFSNYPLQSTKFIPFYLFKSVENFRDKKVHLSLQGLRNSWHIKLPQGATVQEINELKAQI
jgi:hypothetical protein